MGKRTGGAVSKKCQGRDGFEERRGLTTAADAIEEQVVRGTLADGKLKPLMQGVLTGGVFSEPVNQYGWIRVSQVASLCPRRVVLARRNNIDDTEPISPDLALVLEHGTALHWVLQNSVLPRTGTLFGRWACMLCGHTFGGIGAYWDVAKMDLGRFINAQVSRPEMCPNCGKELSSDSCVYREQQFKDSRFRLSGHPDGFLVIPGMDGMGILEAKSISPKGAWEVRGTPKLDHAVQLQCYLWMTGLRWGKILYWDKGGFGLSAIIEHTVEYDKGSITAIQSMIESIHSGLATGTVPDKVCANRTCARASACSVSSLCFGEL